MSPAPVLSHFLVLISYVPYAVHRAQTPPSTMRCVWRRLFPIGEFERRYQQRRSLADHTRSTSD